MVGAEVAFIATPSSMGAVAVLLYFIMRKQDELCVKQEKHEKMLVRAHAKLNLVGQEMRLNRIIFKKEHAKTYNIVFGEGNPVRDKQLEQTFADDDEWSLTGDDK